MAVQQSRKDLLQKIERLERELTLLRGMSNAARSVSSSGTADTPTNRMYDELFEFLPLPAFETDKDGVLTRVNAKSLARFGYEPGEVLYKKRFSDVLRQEDRDRMEEGFNARRKGIKSEGNEYIACTKDGSEFEVLIYADGIFFDNEFQGMRGVLIDMSERNAMEKERKLLAEQLRHARRVESVGRLAAGVAHDFNNLLSPIIGYSEMVIDGLGPHHALADDMKEILSSAYSAKEITHQLLTFGQRQEQRTEALDLNQVIKDTAKLLRRLVPESIHIEYLLNQSHCLVQGDSAGLKQILLNLFVNAGEAIAQRGRITVSTKAVVLDEELQNLWQRVPAGRYVVLEVCDDGRGMDTELQERIFEPFFSTKDEDGSGLGLSTVWGIAKRHNAFVAVKSAPENGTCFSIFFPRGPVVRNSAAQSQRPEAIPNGVSILVVDDDERMCRLVRRLLTQRGYVVKMVTSVSQAKDAVLRCTTPFDLLLTDVVLPELDGKQLATALCRSVPSMKVLYMTGYGPTAMAEYNLADESNVLHKPFDAETLVKKVASLVG